MMTASTPSGARRAAPLLFLLALSYMLSLFDRQLLVLMIGPIKRDMGISDTAFSLLYGFAFTIFYSSLSLVAAPLVDRLNRTRLLAGALVLWSLATAASGLVQSYEGLFVARMLVGVGEATLAPVAYSLIADLFKPHQRTQAFSIYAIGMFVGVGLSLSLGGHLIQMLEHLPPVELPVVGPVRAWQLAFLAASVPGLVVALGFLAAGEPTRGYAATASATERASRPGWGAFLGAFRASGSTLLFHHLAFALLIGQGFANSLWLPTLFTRVRGWPLGEVGLIFAGVVVSAGFAGAYVGPRTIRALQRPGAPDAAIRVCVLACAIGAAGVFTAALATPDWAAVLGVWMTFFTISVTAGPASAMIQLLMPPWAQGRCGAFFTFFTQLLGSSLVPLSIALVGQHIFAGPGGLAPSLMTVAVVTYGLGAGLLWRIRDRFPGPSAEARASTETQAAPVLRRV